MLILLILFRASNRLLAVTLEREMVLRRYGFITCSVDYVVVNVQKIKRNICVESVIDVFVT